MRLKLHLFISLVIIVCTLKTNAQNTTLFPVDNFFMNEYHSEKSIPNPYLFDYEEGSIFTRDHYTKNNKTYYQLYYNYSYFKNSSPNGHTSSGFNQRHIGDLNYDTLLNKVFLNDVLLYDFSLNEGDIYPVTCQHLNLDSNIRVVNIDTIVDPYNIIRKVFYINNFNDTSNCRFSNSSSCAVIIEGIGSVNGILGPLFDCFEDCVHKLNCAKINNKNYEFLNGISIGSCSISNNKNLSNKFPDSNYVYYEKKYHTLFETNPFDVFHYTVYHKKDTLINNTNYQLLYIKYKIIFPSGPPPNVQGEKPIALIRNDKANKKVYIKRFGFSYWNFQIPTDVTEKLLYDFSLKLGDYYTPNANINIPDSLFVIKVDTIIDADNIKRAVYIIDTKPSSFIWKGIVIEGIGGRNGLLGSIFDVMDWSYQEEFNCYSVNGYNYEAYFSEFNSGINYIGYPCGTLSFVSAQNIYLSKITVYPNPTTDFVFFNIQDNIKEINIYNQYGVKMWTGKSNGNSVDVNKLVPGIYLLNIVSSSKSYVSKFLKVE
jgi:hypothetical protein